MNRIHGKPLFVFVVLCIGALAAGCFGGGGDGGGTDVPLTMEIAAEPTSVETGEEVTLTADVKGSGASDATVTWAVDAGSLDLNEGRQVTWTAPDEPGEYTIAATATAGSTTVTARADITVEEADDGSDPVVPLEIELSADRETVDVEEVVELTATVTGTHADDAVVEWEAPDGGTLSSATGREVTWTAPDGAGEYTIAARAGADGEIASAEMLITVEPSIVDLCGTGDPNDENDPRIVCTVEELQDINNHLDGHFALGQNIDAYETEHWHDGAGFEPIGGYGENWEAPFEGTLDGRGFEIQGLHINRPEEELMGLFGYIEDAVIRNIGLVDGLTAGWFSVGGLVGEARGGEIAYSYNENDVQGSDDTGGLVGRIYDGFSITHSHNAGHIKGGRGSGGLVGRGSGAQLFIEHSHNVGLVEGWDRVGGLGGAVSSGVVRHSYNAGEIVATMRSQALFGEIGGLIGLMNGGLVEFSHNEGPVGPAEGVAAGGIGGLVGQEWGDNALVVDSYNTGVVRGTSRVGGVVGHVREAVVERVHNDGDVIGLSRGGRTASNIGGVAGRQHEGSISNSYNTGDVVAEGGFDVGGVVGAVSFGRNNDVVRQSFNTGNVSGEYRVGGVAGYIVDGGLVEDSYNLGSVSGMEAVGGLVGMVWNDRQHIINRINDSYNAGAVTGGGLIGVVPEPEYADVQSSYYDTEASGVDWSAGGEGRPTADMKKQATFVGWDFDDVWTTYGDTDYPDLSETPRP